MSGFAKLLVGVVAVGALLVGGIFLRGVLFQEDLSELTAQCQAASKALSQELSLHAELRCERLDSEGGEDFRMVSVQVSLGALPAGLTLEEATATVEQSVRQRVRNVGAVAVALAPR